MHKENTFKWILAYAVVAVGGYYLLTHNKRHYATIILRYGDAGGGLLALMQLDKGYLEAWSKAAKGHAASFTYQGKTYNSKGGKAI